MAKETINDVEKDHVIAARKEDRVVVLLILLLLYSSLLYVTALKISGFNR